MSALTVGGLTCLSPSCLENNLNSDIVFSSSIVSYRLSRSLRVPIERLQLEEEVTPNRSDK